MKLRVKTLNSSTLEIEGTKRALTRFSNQLNALQRSSDGYIKIATEVVCPGDLNSIELCMTNPAPLVCTKVYRGQIKTYLSVLEFPEIVRLGCFRCNVSKHACQQLSYSLIDEVGQEGMAGYCLPKMRCHCCARPVAFESHCEYQFAYLDKSATCSDARSIMIDLKQFSKEASYVIRRSLNFAEMHTFRAWRKGSAGVVFELTPQVIYDLRERHIAFLLDSSDDHRHYSNSSAISASDYSEIIIWVVDEIGEKRAVNPPVPTFTEKIYVSWAICMNKRCGYRFPMAEYATDDDFDQSCNTLGMSDQYCPYCRTRLSIDYGGIYEKV